MSVQVSGDEVERVERVGPASVRRSAVMWLVTAGGLTPVLNAVIG
jgi:hypothetical protein